MKAVCAQTLEALLEEPQSVDQWLARVSALEQKIDDMTRDFRDRQLNRMRLGVCSDEGCIIFSELLTDFERIGDHALNIAQERAGIPDAAAV